MYTFRCAANAPLHDKQQRGPGKFAPRSRLCILLGYCESANIYKLLDLQKGFTKWAIFNSGSVRFDENRFPIKERSQQQWEVVIPRTVREPELAGEPELAAEPGPKNTAHQTSVGARDDDTVMFESIHVRPAAQQQQMHASNESAKEELATPEDLLQDGNAGDTSNAPSIEAPEEEPSEPA